MTASTPTRAVGSGDASASPDGATPARSALVQERAATLAFGAVLVLAAVLWFGRGGRQWFYLDEWDFLADRRLTDLHDLFRPHAEHWQTIPIVLYRVLYRVVGLTSYRPYQAVTLTLHLVAAVLLWFLMRRSSVNVWIATVLAGAFALFGAGRENVFWGFQVAFTGALAAGLGALLLADHDDRFGRRDAFALFLGLVSLMCSAFGVTMGFVVCLAVLVRRGPRAAAMYAAVLGGAFVTWWLAFGRTAYDAPTPKPVDVAGFVWVGVTNEFSRLGQLPGVGIALFVLLGVGLTLAWGKLPRSRLRVVAAAPGALLAGGAVFLVTTALARVGRSPRAVALGVIEHVTDGGRAGRYVHLLVALTIPALAVAADAVVRRWRIAGPVVLVLLLSGIPGNVDAIGQDAAIDRPMLGSKRFVLALARSPWAPEVPANVRPLGQGGRQLTIGWLLGAERAGRLPTAALTAAEVDRASLVLVVRTRPVPVPRAGCEPFTSALVRTLDAGQSFVVRGKAALQLRSGERWSPPRVVEANRRATRVEARTGPVDLRVSPPVRGPAPELCPAG